MKRRWPTAAPIDRLGVRWKRLFLASDSDDSVSGPSERFHILKLAFAFHLFEKSCTRSSSFFFKKQRRCGYISIFLPAIS
jgi:hypothetical protein